MKIELSKSMTLKQFENGYWYLSELKEFGKTIGIQSANKLRKDELEKAIISFLTSGKIQSPTHRNLSKSGIKDLEKGLSLDLLINSYTYNKETKNFIFKEAEKIAPKLKRKSGVMYRLNRWREEQITNRIAITYGDLANQYIKLNQTQESFAHIPHGRYINFVADFLATEMNATREQAILVWKQLKEMDIPKDYQSWVKFCNQINGSDKR